MKKQLINILALVCMTQLYGYDVQVDEQPLFKKQSKHKEHKQKHCEKKCFKHNIKLQLSDFTGFPVEGTEFYVEIYVTKDGSQVTLELPTINFQTGPQVGPYASYFYPYITGGYLYTSDCFLPEDVRPTDLVYRSIVGASNNGLSLPWDFNDLSSLPVPPAGYIVQVTNAGAIVVQCAGTFGNAIPDGPQILMPCSITYKTKPRKRLCENFIITAGSIDTTQFTDPGAAGNGFRDSHVNTAFGGKMAWSWTDNSMVPEPKTNGTMNCMVAMGKTDKHGKAHVNAPVQLTDFPAEVGAWDTAVTINPVDPRNVIVSYGLIDYTDPLETGYSIRYPCRAVSFDGGKTWPEPYEYVSFIGSIADNILTVSYVYNGTIKKGQTLVTVSQVSTATGIIPYTTITSYDPTTMTGMVNQAQTVDQTLIAASDPHNGPLPLCSPYGTGFGDNRGVSTDKYGNIWYLTGYAYGNGVTGFNQPLFAMSSDKGVTFTTKYILPLFTNVYFYDYPQFCFGGTGDGNPENNYGLHFTVDVETDAGNFYPTVGFIPIMHDSIGTGTQAALMSLLNVNFDVGITASIDGKVWYQGIPFFVPNTYITPVGVIFKSPGALDVNYAGPWSLSFFNGIVGYNITLQESQPVEGYRLPGSTQSLIYDDARQALYCVLAVTNPDYSQNMRLNFIISRDNGQTWSDPLDLSTTDFANRGFQSMALDPVTGDLIFGWYDGRNDPTYTSVQYFGARISAKELDKMVAEIPYSNPVYNLPSAAVAPTKAIAIDSGMQPKGDKFNKFMQKRLAGKHPHLTNIKDKLEKIKEAKAK